jgi:hypothetical protein
MRVHVLSSGYCYDIPARTPHLPSEPRPYVESGYVGGEGI